MAASSSGVMRAADLCVCRCCLAAGCDKDLSSSYLHSGVEEVYADMMKETFDIEFDDDIGSYHICCNCITELRRAYDFKKRTITSSKRFLQHVNQLMLSKRGNFSTTQITKTEKEDERESENESDYYEVEMLDETLEQEEEYGKLDCIKTETGSESVSQCTRNTKRKMDPDEYEPETSNTPTKKIKQEPQSSLVTKKMKTSENLRNVKIIKVETMEENEENEEEHYALDNLLILLENSNMCLFHHNCNQDEFQCYVCTDTFPELKLLREHTKKSHSTPDVVISVLESETDRGILAEISHLKCSNCNQPCDSVDNLIKHLMDKHSIVLGKFSDVLPFKVVEEGLVCVCGAEFESFGVLRDHCVAKGCAEVETCDVCGEAVRGKGSMAEHIKTNHGADNQTKSYKRISNAVAIVSNSNACPFHWPLVRQQRFKCYCCSEHFTEFSELRLHYTTNHDIEVFRKEVKQQGVGTVLKLEITGLKCTECGEECDSLGRLRAHLQGVHGLKLDEDDFILPLKIEGEGYKCLECAQEFSGWSALNRHLRVTHTDTQRTCVCMDCGKQFLSKKALRNHVQNTHTATNISKPTALRSNTMTLLKHSNMTIFHHEGVSFRCFCCQQSYLNFAQLKHHFHTHDTQTVEAAIRKYMNRFFYIKVDITGLKCNKCQQIFDDIDGLKLHLTDSHEMHFWKDGENYLVPYLVNGCYQCGFCREEFRVMQTLTRHVNSHMSKEICEVCGSAFFNATFLKAHMRKRHGAIKCALCNITFESLAARRNHNKQHKNELPKKSLKCAFCEEAFNSSEIKYAHMKTVHDYQPPEYPCTLCDRMFYTKGGYENHQLNHSTANHWRSAMKHKLIPCKYCPKMLSKVKLEEHILHWHKNAQKYTCHLCSENFTTADQLCRHVIDRHGHNKPTCPLCKFVPKSKQFMLLHLKEVHRLGDIDGMWDLNVGLATSKDEVAAACASIAETC